VAEVFVLLKTTARLAVPLLLSLKFGEYMTSVDVKMPADLVAAAKLDQGCDVSLEAAKLIALELFREDKISLGRAAELCRMPIQAFMDYAGEHGAALHYGLEELDQDRRNIARLGL
jgi:predicted HTH domain antitoxin